MTNNTTERKSASELKRRYLQKRILQIRSDIYRLNEELDALTKRPVAPVPYPLYKHLAFAYFSLDEATDRLGMASLTIAQWGETPRRADTERGE